MPLFWDRPGEGEPLSVRFRVYRRSDPDAPAEAPIVAFEGGPGYGSIGSNAAYRFLFEPLLRDRDLILMDQRGTGASSTIDCPALQKGIGNYTRAVAACAEQLGDAANAYGSAAAADDLAAILAALEVPSVVVYGDSYGTYLAQVFAIRHPELTEAVVLDARVRRLVRPVRPRRGGGPPAGLGDALSPGRDAVAGSSTTSPG